MADIVLRKADGWVEITDILPNWVSVKELWDVLGQGRVKDAINILDQEACDELEELIGQKRIRRMKIIAIPDDIHGAWYRVWINTRPKAGKGSKEWAP